MSDSKETPVVGRRSLNLSGLEQVKDEKTETDSSADNDIKKIPDTPIPEGVRENTFNKFNSFFLRSPRDFIPFPKGEVVIQSPGKADDPPDSSIVSLILPLAGSLVGLLLTVIAISTSPLLALISLPMILFSVLGGIYKNRQEQKKYEAKKTKREQLFQTHLEESRKTLDRLVDEQRKASLIPNPSLDECLQRVERHNVRLWERKPEDSDFLDIRLGLGNASPTFVVKPPPLPDAVQEPDVLYKKALALTNEYKVIDDMPVTLPLMEVVTAGLIGSSSDLVKLTRSILIQLATHHAPNEVKIILCISENEIDQWDWSRWLPHTWRDDHQVRMIASNEGTTQKILSDLEQVIKQRQNNLDPNQENSTPIPALVLIFSNPKIWRGNQARVYKPLLELLSKDGDNLGVYSIFLDENHVPKECRGIINLDGTKGTLKIIGPSPEVVQFIPDYVEISKTDQFARKLAGLRTEQATTGSNDIPKVIPLLKLLGVDLVEELKIYDNWEKTKFDQSLSVPLGIGTGGKVISLDMHERAQGPHGLLAGTSGSGKSELLQAFITSLSIRFSPEKVAFILIDYKALMVPPFYNLPHQLGIITNLSGNLATRALIGLQAEKERRNQLLLNQSNVSFDDYQELYFKGNIKTPLPHLFIIVDEFAELKVIQPEFIQGLISLASVGRGLGMHLILATQKPAGVINETIWANSRTRLCLRVEREEDSQEVLKRQDAAAINSENKGRAYLQVGMNEIFEQFQVAWATAPYITSAKANKHDLASIVDLDGSVRPFSQSKSSSVSKAENPSQMDIIISHIIQTRKQQRGVQPLKRPWLPPLENIIFLKDIRVSKRGWNGNEWTQTGRWLNPIIGIFDDPAGQTHGNLSIPLGSEGNLCIYGAPGSGKTGLVQTMITSLILDHSPKDLHLYFLDFGSRSYKVFEDLPHVGAIVLPDETDRIHRLLLFIKQELDRRKRFLEPYGGKITNYRSQRKGDLADIVLFLDNYTAFANAFNDQIMDLSRLASEGRNLGMHLVLTTNSVSSLSISLASNISQSIALDLVDPSDYITVVGRTNDLTPTRGIPGRGLIKGTPSLEFQTALAVENPRELIDLVQKMKSVYSGECACHVPPIQEVVSIKSILCPEESLSSLPSEILNIPLGIDLGTPELGCFSVDLNTGNHIWIAGPPFSGKTTFMQTFLIALSSIYSPQRVRLIPVDMGSMNLSEFAQMPHTQSYISNGDQFEITLQEISEQLDKRAQEKKNVVRNKLSGISTSPQFLSPALVMAIDNLEDLRRETSESNRLLLSNLMRRKGLGFHVVATGSSVDFSSYGNSDNLGNVFKENITGFLIGYNNYDDLQYLPLKLSPIDIQKNLSPGTAFFVQKGGRYRIVQIASCLHGNTNLQEWIELISGKWADSNS